MVRKTISISEDLERRILAVAERKRLSFSAAVVAVLEDRLDSGKLPYEGAGDGPSDLAERADAYLDRLAEERSG